MAKQLSIKEFDLLYNNYKNMVLRTACMITNDSGIGEDVMQEVFIKAYKFWDTYDSQKGKVSTWLYRITVNECLAQKKLKSTLNISLDEIEEDGMFSPDNEKGLDETVYDKLSTDEFLNSLSIKYRSVLILRYFNDLTYGEIAEILKIPLGTVKSRINAAIHDLRKINNRINI